MFSAILKAKSSSFQKGMTFFHTIYVKKVIKLRGSSNKERDFFYSAVN